MIYPMIQNYSRIWDKKWRNIIELWICMQVL